MAGLGLQEYGHILKSEELANRLELLTSERRSVAESLALYILRRQATLQIVIIRSRNLSVELIRT